MKADGGEKADEQDKGSVGFHLRESHDIRPQSFTTMQVVFKKT
jgi:hypothetical protein